MNAMTGNEPEKNDEPEIVLVGLGKENYFLMKGEEHINQLLLVDGDFPKPILCRNFNDMFEAKLALGDLFNPGTCWSIHPEIVARMRRDEDLIETDA